MHPQLWVIPGLNLPLHSYGFMVMLGFLAGILVASRRAKKQGLNPEVIFDLGIIVMIAGIIGARIAYIIIFPQDFRTDWQMFNIFDGGLNLLGGISGWFIPWGYLFWKHRRITPRTLLWLVPVSLAGALIAGRVLYLAFGDHSFVYTDENNQIHTATIAYTYNIFKIWQGGLVFYGGLILAIPAGLYYFKKKGLNVWFVGDLTAPAIALGLAFGRIGCLLNGCCYGRVAGNNPLGICFPNLNGSPLDDALHGHSPVFYHQLTQNPPLVGPNAPYSLPVYPTQVYEAVFAVLLFIGLSLIPLKKVRTGLVLGLFVMLYSLGRFIIEFYRGDKDVTFASLTDSQVISVVLFALAAGFLIYLVKRPKKMEDTPASH